MSTQRKEAFPITLHYSVAREGYLIETTSLLLAGFLLMEDEVALTDLGPDLGQVAMYLGKLTEFL